MTKTRFVGVVAVVVALIAFHGVSPSAQAQVAQPQFATLPDVPLTTATGAASTTGRALPAQGRWLLVHIQPNCVPCDALLARIAADAPAVVPRLVIVVSRANGADLARMAGTSAGLESAAWFVDETGSLGTALQIQEAPLMLAMNDRAIQWTLAGVLSTSQRLRDVLTGWVATPGAVQ